MKIERKVSHDDDDDDDNIHFHHIINITISQINKQCSSQLKDTKRERIIYDSKHEFALLSIISEGVHAQRTERCCRKEHEAP
jgi:hypothetical protein